MKRSIHIRALAILLGAAGAHAAAQTTTAGAADPQAPVPATQARPVIDYRTEPAPAASPDSAWRDANATVGGRNAMRLTMPGMDKQEHDHGHAGHAGMDMGAMQCKAGDGKGGCGGAQGMQCMAGGGDRKGCCAGTHDTGHAAHGEAMTGMQCKKGDGKCGCCADMKKDGCCCNHKEAP